MYPETSEPDLMLVVVADQGPGDGAALRGAVRSHGGRQPAAGALLRPHHPQQPPRDRPGPGRAVRQVRHAQLSSGSLGIVRHSPL